MKKIIALLLAVIFSITPVFADNSLPAFLTQTYNNCTETITMSIAMDNCDDIIALLDELGIPEEVGLFVDVRSLLTSLCTGTSKIVAKVDATLDYKKIKLSLTSSDTQTIIPNANLELSYKGQSGLWLEMDLTNIEKPVLVMVFSAPFLNKYAVIDISQYLTPEVLTAVETVANKEYIDAVTKAIMDSFAKHMDIKASGNKYTITVDNAGYVAMMNELTPMVLDMMAAYDNTGVYEELVMPDMSELSFLGKDGIKMVYTLSGGKISLLEETLDFSIDIAKYYEVFSGEPWPFTSKGLLEFTVTSTAKVSDLGNTTVKLPELTAENSFSVMDMLMAEPDYPQEDDDQASTSDFPEYPAWYADAYSEKMPQVDGKLYVPLRGLIEDAYGDTAVIGFENGVITVTSEYFTNFKKLTITAGSDKYYLDETEYTYGAVILEDGTTYVDAELFTDAFGWELSTAYYDFVENIYGFAFFTVIE